MRSLRLLLIAIIGCLLSQPRSASGQNMMLRYYDPIFAVDPLPQVPEVNHSQAVAYIGVSQRFTLPSPSGFLDSIRILFSEVSGEVLHVRVYKDRIAEDSKGDLVHLIDFTQTGELGETSIDVSALNGEQDVEVVVPFPHIPVKTEFHVLILANQVQDDEFNSSFRIFYQPHHNRPASIESRANVVVTADFLNYEVRPLDGFFMRGGLPLGIELRMDAFVETSQASVHPLNERGVACYPNPVGTGDAISVRSKALIKSVVFTNILGQRVRDLDVNAEETEISTAGIPSGVYQLQITTELGSTSVKIVIE